MAGYKLTRSSLGRKIKSYGLNHIEETHPAADQDRAAYTKILRAPGSAPLSLLHSCPGEVRMIPSRGGPAPSIHVFAPRTQLQRSAAHHHGPATPKICGGADGQRHGRTRPRDDAPNHTSSGHRRCGGRRRVRRARAGVEIDHSEPQARVWLFKRAAGPEGARNTSGATSNKNPGT